MCVRCAESDWLSKFSMLLLLLLFLELLSMMNSHLLIIIIFIMMNGWNFRENRNAIRNEHLVRAWPKRPTTLSIDTKCDKKKYDQQTRKEKEEKEKKQQQNNFYDDRWIQWISVMRTSDRFDDLFGRFALPLTQRFCVQQKTFGLSLRLRYESYDVCGWF